MLIRTTPMLLVAAMTAFLVTADAADIYVPDDHPTIQDAINAAVDGDTVWVRAGIWAETIDFVGKAITVKSVAGPAVTAINAQRQGSVVTFQNSEWPDSVIEGFTLVDGVGDNGGGICCQGSSPSILNNVIYANLAKNTGGGIYSGGGRPEIRGNLIHENRAKARGCGIGCDLSSQAIIEHNIIMDNYQQDLADGGGIHGHDAAPAIRGNYIVRNTAWSGGGIELFASGSYGSIQNNFIAWNTTTATVKYGGGGIYMNLSEPLVTGNIITGNCAAANGGGLWVRQVYPVTTFFNNTIVGNDAAVEGGGIYCYETDLRIANTIFWNNTAPLGKEISLATQQKYLDLSHSVVEGGQASVYVDPGATLNWGPGMIDADPLFVEPGGDDFHLRYDSPCRNTGDSSVSGMPADDFEGDPRVADVTVDMGADEFYPHLYGVGTAVPGGAFTIRVVGPPGSSVVVGRGSGLLDPPYQSPLGPIHLLPPITQHYLPATSPEGVSSLQAVVPSWSQPGDWFPLQGWLAATGEVTNLFIIEVE